MQLNSISAEADTSELTRSPRNVIEQVQEQIATLGVLSSGRKEVKFGKSSYLGPSTFPTVIHSTKFQGRYYYQSELQSLQAENLGENFLLGSLTRLLTGLRCSLTAGLETSVPCRVGLFVMQPQGMGAGLSQNEGCQGEYEKVPKMGPQSFTDLTSEVIAVRLCLLSGNH